LLTDVFKDDKLLSTDVFLELTELCSVDTVPLNDDADAAAELADA
jgi:hypothetical protein